MIRPPVPALIAGLRSGDRALLGQAISLVESRSPRQAEAADQLLSALLPLTGGAWRLGVTGVPGAGKSTFIDALGGWLIDRGHRVAVLAVDPSSVRSGGSILGDKTRMARLCADDAAFVRPSPAGGTLGGVSSRTREAMIVVEAAGYDVVIVETVGVGQSELAVAGMTDLFLALILAGAGDELQGIKRGLMELVDVLVVNKADGDNLLAAERAARTTEGALRLLRGQEPVWTPRVLTVSSLERRGLPEVWEAVAAHRAALSAAGLLEQRRAEQRVRWLWERLDEGLRQALARDPRLAPLLPEAEARVRAGEQPPPVAARALLHSFLDR